uniref:Acyltransferase 3 domain-containing protein n=1 Tax=Parascaris equorum TaxID=6256 RepID=A0A914RAY3_PAREQ
MRLLSTFFVLVAKVAVIAQLRSYNETTVFRFIDDAARRNVFRAYECLQAAGEATYSKSEHPLHYCFGYNEAKEKIGAVAHGICIPSTCYDDRAQLLEQWRVQNGNDKDAIDYTSCTKSRHDQQWYQKVIPLAEFALHLTFILVAIIATIYHVRNGDQTKYVSYFSLPDLCVLLEPEPTWTSWGYWLRYYRHRVIRLWPAYIYTLVDVGLRASVQHFHPMWPPTDPAVQCPKYWWQNVLFVNSLFSNRCMPWTWYIGTEFIFYLLSPIFLLTLRNTPKIGFALAIITITSSAALNAAGMIAWNFPPTQLLWKQPDIFSADFIQHHIVMYIKPWYRIGPYIIGLLLGYYIAGVQRLAQKVQRSLHFCVIGWSLASLALFWTIFGLYPALQVPLCISLTFFSS